MTLGKSPRQADLFRGTTEFCEGRVKADSIYALLHRECMTLFPDELFADLFTDLGRASVPPMIVAVVMVLQRMGGCSDREAVERFTYDARWKYAAGGLPFDYPGFAHTVLVDMRARLASSSRPNRIFEVTLDVAKAAGLVGVRRVLDSTPLYDAVATMDTVILVRSAIRRTLAAAGEREHELRGVLRRNDDYASLTKPVCDYEDRADREALIDALATPCLPPLRAIGCSPGSMRLRHSWHRCSARTSTRVPTASCVLPGESRPIGSSAPSIRRLATVTRPQPTSSMATRATLPSIPMPN
jgi:hypothetical protein